MRRSNDNTEHHFNNNNVRAVARRHSGGESLPPARDMNHGRFNKAIFTEASAA